MNTFRHEQGASALEAIAHPTRLTLIAMVVEAGPAGLASGEIARRVGLSAPLASHHLGWLAEAGLLVSKRIGRSIVYRAAARALGELVRGLERDLLSRGRNPVAAPTTVSPGPRTMWRRVMPGGAAQPESVWRDFDHRTGIWRSTVARPYRRGLAVDRSAGAR